MTSVRYAKPRAEPRRARDVDTANPPEERTVSAPVVTRSAALRGEFDDAAFTIDAVVATATPVMRRDAVGPYAEVLAPSAFRLPADDVPLIDEHQRGSTRHVIGRAFNFRLEGGEVVATLRFSTADDVAPIIQRVRDGTLKHFSVGYRVARWQDSNENGKRIRTAIDWQISEVSLVGQPADPDAKRIRNMPDIEELEDVTVEPTMPEADAQRIRSLGELADLPPSVAEGLIERNVTVEEARTEIRSAMTQRTRTIPTIRTAVGTDHTDPTEIRRRAEGALVARMEGSEVPEESREFAGMSLSGLAANLMIARGERVRHGETPEAILTRAAQHTTSDFPALLTGAGNRVLANAYQSERSPLVSLCRRGSHTDFRGKSFLRIGELGELQKVSESGEIRSTSRGEATEGYSLDTYGAIFSLSRKAIVNDDLGAFGDFARAAAQAAAATEANLLVNLLTASSGAGPVMGDGKRMFVATHGNVGTHGGVAVSGPLVDLGDARLAMRRQLGLDGKTPIRVVPKYWVIAPEYERIAEQVVAEITPARTEDTTGFARELTLLVEPRLSGESWYLFADPASLPCFEIGYLASAPGPQMSSRDGWEVLGREFRVTLDVGVGALDWRGAFFSKAV